MKIPKEASHLISKGDSAEYFYSQKLAKIWFGGQRWSSTEYSIEILKSMGFKIIKLKPIVLENK